MKKLLLVAIAFGFACFFSSQSMAALSGAYTIDGGGTATATNYLTFTAAISDMVNGTRPDGGPTNGPGISAAVTFTVAAGTYNEKISIPPITGASATNTITFDGVNPATRKITYAGITTSDYTVQLNGADYIRIYNLGIENTGTTYGYGVQFQLNADNNEIKGCNINLGPSSTSAYKVGVIFGTYYTTQGQHGSNNLVENNTINGGRVNIAGNGQSTVHTSGLTIRNNNLTNTYYAGLYLGYYDQLNIEDNLIDLALDYYLAYGMQVRYCQDFNILSNTISHPGSYGLYVYYANQTSTNQSLIANNMVGGNFRYTGTGYGLYLYGSRYVGVYHNSFLLDGPGTGARGLYLSGTSTALDIRNNSFATTTTGPSAYAFYIVSPTYVQTLDYNDYYSNGTNLAYFGANYATLAAMQTGQPTYNQNSQSVWPNYYSASDLHTYGAALSNWAANSTPIIVDIDGQNRPMAPDVIKDVGADEFLLPPVDLDVWAINSPTVLSLGNNTVSALMQNNGTNNLNGTNVTLQYSTDGGTTWPVTQIFTPTTLNGPGSQEIFTFTTPWNVATPGTYNLCIRINPLLPGDPDPTDQICASVCTGLGGNYTINNGLPTGGTNYNSFTDAVAALASCGINSACNFTVAAGTYTEQISIPAITGASAVNTVTFDGLNAANVTLTQALSTTNSAVVQLNGADYVRFKNMTIASTGTYGFCFHLTNTADYNQITDCIISMPLTSTSTYHIGIVISGNTYSAYGDNGNYNLVQNNTISGGYYGVRVNGISSTAFVQNNKILDNTINDFYYTGIYSIYHENAEFNGNTIIGRSSGSVSGYGIYSYYSIGNFKHNYNTIHSIGARAIYLGYGNRNNVGHGELNNNMLGANFYTTSTAYGLYIYNTVDTEIKNNSIHLGGMSGYAVYSSGSPTLHDSLYFYNNIFSASNPGYGSGGQAMFISSSSAVYGLDYNIYYTTGPILAQVNNITYTDLASWQTAQPAYNQNSIEDAPGFISNINLHIICSPNDNMGSFMGITDDIDGDTRSTSTPDIGADEFNGITISMDLGADTSNCGLMELWADTNYVLYQWGGGQYLPWINVDTTGYYYLEVTDSNNCRASDSIFVEIFGAPTAPYSGDTISQCDYVSLDAQNTGSTFLWSTSDTSQTMVPPSPGWYFVDITSPDGCLITDSVLVNFYQGALANLGPDTTFCQGVGTLLDAGAGPSGTTYLWNSGATSQQVLISAPGYYAVTVTTPQGCNASDSVLMNILPAPVVELGADRYECDQFTLDAGTFGVAYQWSTSATSQTISGTTSGTYVVTVTNSLGCSSVDSVAITVAATPTVNIGPDQIICDNQSVFLDAGNPGMNYFWSNLATTQTITVTTGGTYIVEVTEPVSGCAGYDTVLVSQSFLSLNIGPDFTLCQGQTAILNAGSGGTSWLWNTGATTQDITISTGGTYTVQATDGFGCIAFDTIVIANGTNPTAYFTSAGTVPLWQPITFSDSSNPASTWFWDFGDGSTSTQQNPTHTYQAMGTFTVCLTVSDGTCEDTYCMDVTVGAPLERADEVLADNVSIFPNPNTGYFHIGFDLPKSMNFEVDIVNLAGQRVYHTTLKNVMRYRETVDITSQASGIYFLRLQSDKGDELIKKIVIQ